MSARSRGTGNQAPPLVGRDVLADLEGLEAEARRLAGTMTLCLQGSLLVRHAPPEVADAFCASRLGGAWGGTFGTLPRGAELAALVRRTTPRHDR